MTRASLPPWTRILSGIPPVLRGGGEAFRAVRAALFLVGLSAAFWALRLLGAL